MKRLIQSHETLRDVIGIVSPWTRECDDWTKSTSRATLTDSLIGFKLKNLKIIYLRQSQEFANCMRFVIRCFMNSTARNLNVKILAK